MAAKIKTHRENQIGGCVTEIWTEKTRILIDFGEELPGSRSGETLNLDWGESTERGRKKPAINAVFFTHYHGDHIGRFAEAYQHADLYMSELARDVLIHIHEYLKDNLPWLAKRKGGDEAARLLEEARQHADAVDILKENGVPQDKKRLHTFCPLEKKTMEIGDIRVTPFWVDHSAADACMLLVEAGDKRILHTGDFRGHGIQGKDGAAACEAVKNFAAEKSIDILITEGTMMSRRDEEPYTEEDLLKAAKQFFQERRNRHAFLIVSSTNLDSISTFYQAAKENHLPMYCHNPYAERQIKALGEYARKHWGRPGMEDVERVRPWDTAQLHKMREEGFVTIIKGNEMCRELVKQFEDCGPVVICSLWQGYYQRKLDDGLCRFIDACKEENIPVYPLTDSSYGPMHTSGHASPALIAQLIDAADPEEIRPIHTEGIGGFFQLDIAGDPKRSHELKQRLNINGYRWVEDHRFLSPPSLAKFLEEKDGAKRGSHRAFIELVKDRHPDELAFCLRGNSSNQATIYYRNHIVFRILSKGKLEFDFGHARYMKETDWCELKKKFIDFGYKFEENQETGIVSLPAEKAGVTLEKLELLYSCIKPLIDSFSKEKGLAEKYVQQQLFLDPGFKQLKNGYFFYDLEFRQPHAKDLRCQNQPDMLAVRFDADGKPKGLAFVEVKSKKESLYGNSGVKPHVWGMERYPDWLLPIRSFDACKILNQYMEIGLIEGRHGPFREEDFTQLSKEALLIFTGTSTINALNAEKETKPEPETIKEFLSAQGYTPADGLLPQPAGIDQMMVYRKDFGPSVV